MKQSPEEKAAAAAAELRAVIREGHELAQGLNQAMRLARAQIDEYHQDEIQKHLNRCLADMQKLVDDWHTDAKEDVRRCMERLNVALSSVCTIIEMRTVTGRHPNPVMVDYVIDMRGDDSRILSATDPEAQSILDAAPYKVVVGPGARDTRPGAHPGGIVS